MDLRDGLFLGALISEWQKASLILPYPLPPVSHTHSFENVQAVLTVLMNNGFLLKTNSESIPRSPQGDWRGRGRLEGEREIGGGEGDWRGRGRLEGERVLIEAKGHYKGCSTWPLYLSLHMCAPAMCSGYNPLCAVVITRYVAYNFNGRVYIRDYDTLMLYFR